MAHGFEERSVEVCTISGISTRHTIACLHQNEELVSSSGATNNSSPLSLCVSFNHASVLYAQKHERYSYDGCQQVRFKEPRSEIDNGS